MIGAFRHAFAGTGAVFSREFRAYFATPVAYVFIVVFLAVAGILTFYPGNLFDRGQADLRPFFSYHPWLYLVFMPAVAMRLWAEERRSGTIELLMTLPVGLMGAVLGKFLAAWAFAGVALALTVPAWATVAFLGDPDHGAILAGYLGSFLMAGGYLAIGSCFSAATKNQVVAFVLAVAAGFVFTAAGAPLVLDAVSGWAPRPVVETIASFSFLTRFQGITAGVLAARDLVFFLSLAAVWLFANAVIVEAKKGN
ncbi:MAG: ABC transporter permease [Alphaproteobacteria bacterium]|nr:ABC transporter permease [Alphaproteobacteria bacterium]